MSETLEEFKTRMHQAHTSFDDLAEWYYARRKECHELSSEVTAVEDAAYAFMRHIQDQIEQEEGWMQFDYYRPEIDTYAYNQFCEALGSKDHAKSSELLRRFTDLTRQKRDV